MRAGARVDAEDADRDSCCALVGLRWRAKQELSRGEPVNDVHGSTAEFVQIRIYNIEPLDHLLPISSPLTGCILEQFPQIADADKRHCPRILIGLKTGKFSRHPVRPLKSGLSGPHSSSLKIECTSSS